MAEETKKRAPLKIILKIFIALCAVCAIFLIGGYFYISSAGFIRRHVFPRIEKNLNRKISAEGISFSPFSSIKFSRMKIANPAKPGEPPLFAADEISVRYRALSFLAGAPVIHEISAVKPEINVLVFHNGTTNLDDIIPKQPAGKPAAPKTAEKKPAEPSAPQPPAALPDFSLENFDMRGGVLRLVSLDEQEKEKAALSLVARSVKIENLRPEKESKISADMEFELNEPAVKTKMKIANISFEAPLFFSRDFSSVKTSADFGAKNFSGTFHGVPMEDSSIKVALNLAKEKKSFELAPATFVFSRKGAKALNATIQGAYEAKSGGGKFEMALSGIDKNLLNLIGARAGNVDFLKTNIDYKGGIVIAEMGNKIDVSGNLIISNFSILAPEHAKTPTPEINLLASHELSLEKAAKKITIAKASIKGTQKGREFVSGDLEKPLMLDLSMLDADAPAAPPIAFRFKLSDLDLLPYLELAALPEKTRLSAALVNSDMNFVFENNGLAIELSGETRLNLGEGAVMGSDFPEMEISAKTQMSLYDFARLKLKNLEAGVSQKSAVSANVKISGEADAEKGSGAFALEIKKFDLPAIAALLPMEEININGGNLTGGGDINILFAAKANPDAPLQADIKGNFNLAGFSARVMEKTIPATNIASRVDIGVQPPRLEIREMSAILEQAGAPRVNAKFSGSVDNEKGEAALQMDVSEFDIKTVADFIPMPDVSVSSGKAAAKASVALSQQFKQFSVNGDFSLSSLACSIMGNDIIDFGANASLDFSGSAAGDLDIRRMNAELKTGGKVSGVLDVEGKIDSKEGKGSVKISARDVKEDIFKLALAPYLVEARLESLTVNAEQNLLLSEQFKNISLNGTASASNLKLVSKADGGDYIPPLDMRFRNNIQYAAPFVKIGEVSLITAAVGKDEETITLSGDFILDEKSAAPSTLYLKSEKITLDNFLPPAFFEKKEPPKGAARSSAAAPARAGSRTPASAPEEPAPLNLNYLSIKAVVDIKNASFQQILFSDIKSDITMSESKLDIPNAEMTINGGKTISKFRMFFNVPLWKYEAETNVSDLPMGPFVNTFAPKYKDKITGSISGGMNVSGEGITMPNLEKNLAGKIKGDLKDGRFSGIQILDSLAHITRVKELSDITFFKGVLDAEIGAGKININDLSVQGTQQKLGTKGFIGLDEKIDLSFKVAVSEQFGSKLKDIKYLGETARDKDGYIELPSLVGMKGTITDPKPTIKMDDAIKTGQKLLEGYLERREQKRNKK